MNVFAEGEWSHVSKVAPPQLINLNPPSNGNADANGATQLGVFLSQFLKVYLQFYYALHKEFLYHSPNDNISQIY